MTNNLAVPILIVHKGNQEYLHICLKQAHYSNPNSRIILLGDESNKNCLPFVEWYNVHDYYTHASKFEKIYRHFSCNPFEYERFAFSRWFAINDFMKEQHLEQLFVNDSDVLIFTDFEKDVEHNIAMKNYDFIRAMPGDQHSIFFYSQDVLQKFCNYIMSIFENEQLMNKLAEMVNMPDWCAIPKNIKRVQNPDALLINNWDFAANPLSDMTVQYWFIQDNKSIKYFDYATNDVAGRLINTQMEDDKYICMGRIINVVYINGLPFAYNKRLNKLVQLHTMHFQGWKKELMGTFATYDKPKEYKKPVFTLSELVDIYYMPNIGKKKLNLLQKLRIEIILLFFAADKKRKKNIKKILKVIK